MDELSLSALTIEKRVKTGRLFLAVFTGKKAGFPARCHPPSPRFKRGRSLPPVSLLHQFPDLGLNRVRCVTKLYASGVKASCQRGNGFPIPSSGVVFLKQASIPIGREALALAPLGAPHDTREEPPRILFA